MSRRDPVARRKQQEKLLKHFPKDSGYAEKRISEHTVLVKAYDGANDRWQVLVFTIESFRRYKMYAKRPDKITYEDRKAAFEKAKKANQNKKPTAPPPPMEKVSVADILGGMK